MQSLNFDIMGSSTLGRQGYQRGYQWKDTVADILLWDLQCLL
jgi:hypothetical protein